MSSLYDDLSQKLSEDPSLIRRGGPRADIGLLLFNARDSLRDLWVAADIEVAEARSGDRRPSEALQAAVEELRPLFGDRSE